jgi:transketolase
MGATIPLSELPAVAERVRKDIVRMGMEGNYGHIAPALSCSDILVTLLYHVASPDDVLILSKGHAALAWYAATGLHAGGRPPDERPIRLPGCLTRDSGTGTPCTTGSLGHGLPFSVGCALARKRLARRGRVGCILGDAECEEGSCYEAFTYGAALAGEEKLVPWTVIFDCNGFGAMHKTDNLNLCDSLTAIGGHNFHEMATAFKSEKPFIACRTIKGKGVPFMEGRMEWHYRMPTTTEELSWIESYLSSEPTSGSSS